MKVLLLDVAALGEKGLLWRSGYVYIDGDSIVASGEGDPPPEYQFAELVAGGRGRVVLPGFTAAGLMPELYFVRGRVPPSERGCEAERWLRRYSSVLGGDVSYYSSLLALYEASLSGYASVVVLAWDPVAVARAVRDSGLHGVVYQHPSSTVRATKQAVEAAGDGRVLFAGRLEGPLPAPCVGIRWLSPWIALSFFQDPIDFVARLLDVARSLGVVRGSPPEPMSTANLVVVDASEPPAWTPEPGWRWLVGSTPRVESVFSRGSLVVDGGRHIYLGPKQVAEASTVLEKALEGAKP